MKRFACMVLAAALLALCGCGAAPSGSGSSGAPAPVQGPGLARHSLVEAARKALAQEDAPARVRLWGDAYDSQRVETSPALLSAIGGALYYGAQGNTAEAETAAAEEGIPVPTPTSGADEPLIVVTVPGAQLEIDLQMEGEGCTVIVVLDGESAVLDYPASVYRAVLAAAQASLVPDTLVFEGDTLPLQTPGGGQEVTITQWMECAGGLAALYSWYPSEDSGEQTSALEIFDPETGESLYRGDIGAHALRMEGASFSACDMRVVMADGAMWYLNSQSPDTKPYYFYLPQALRDRLLAPIPMDRPVFRAYDGGTGQGAVWAVVDEEGLTWARRSNGGTVANDVILENLPEDLTWNEDFPPQFGDVRLMNGGATLVATVVLPSSQIGEAGIFTYQISSGAMGWYFGMFKPMLADLRFVDDTNLLVAGDEEIFHLNVATGESTTTPSPEYIGTSQTPDYERYVFAQSHMNPDGTETAGLYASYRDEPIATATGGAANPLRAAGATQNYIMLVLQDGGSQAWHLARWP